MSVCLDDLCTAVAVDEGLPAASFNHMYCFLQGFLLDNNFECSRSLLLLFLPLLLLQSSYFVLSFYLLMPFVFMSLFTSDKRFFAADTTARLYHPFQYYMAKISVTMPFNILVVAIFHLIYYGMVGMRHGVVPMGQSCLISILMGVTAMQVGRLTVLARVCILSSSHRQCLWGCPFSRSCAGLISCRLGIHRAVRAVLCVPFWKWGRIATCNHPAHSSGTVKASSTSPSSN